MATQLTHGGIRKHSQEVLMLEWTLKHMGMFTKWMNEWMNACCILEKDKYFGIDIEFLLLQNPGSECVCTYVRGGWWSWSFCLRHRSLIPLYLPVTNVPVRECPSPQFVSPPWFGARLKTPRLPGLRYCPSYCLLGLRCVSIYLLNAEDKAVFF